MLKQEGYSAVLIVTGLEQAARSRKELSGSKRKPFYFCIDEFQDFCSNDGAAQTLAQILSECRKFGLHLTLAHQTLAQINQRMKGALGNIQLKVVFGVSRQDAETLAKHLFMADSHTVKHEVQDSNQQSKSHPIYYSLLEEWEKSIQLLQSLKSRTAFVRRPKGTAVTKLKTITVNHGGCSEDDLICVKAKLSQQFGLARDVLAQQAQGRTNVLHATDNNEPNEIVKKPPILRQKSS